MTEMTPRQKAIAAYKALDENLPQGAKGQQNAVFQQIAKLEAMTDKQFNKRYGTK